MNTAARAKTDLLAPSTTARYVAGDAAAAYGIWNTTVICFGRATPDIETARCYCRAIDDVARFGDGWSTIAIIQGGSTPPPEVRDFLVKTFRDYSESMVGAAFVLEAEGFAAAIQRSVISALLIAVGKRERVRIFGNVHAAAPWLADRLARERQDLDARTAASRLLATLDRFRAQYSMPPPT